MQHNMVNKVPLPDQMRLLFGTEELFLTGHHKLLLLVMPKLKTSNAV